MSREAIVREAWAPIHVIYGPSELKVLHSDCMEVLIIASG
jgi:hypothetical protein